MAATTLSTVDKETFRRAEEESRKAAQKFIHAHEKRNEHDYDELESLAAAAASMAAKHIGEMILCGDYDLALKMQQQAEYFTTQALMMRDLREANLKDKSAKNN